ncbi:MAG: DMT family transporter [Nevskia sp.]
MKMLVYLVLALIAGAFLPLQAGLNGQLKMYLGGPAQAALVSFAAGTTALLVWLLVNRTPLPQSVAHVSWWLWLGGGLLGACYVTLIIVLTPVLGVALTFGLIVAGQMAMSLAVDQFGWFGLAAHAVNGWRLAGAALIVAGVVLIRRS